MTIYKEPQSMTASQKGCFITYSSRYFRGINTYQKRSPDSILETQQRFNYIKRRSCV